MPKRCQWRGINVHPQVTRDSITFSDAAAEQTAVATFRKGHNVTCRCLAEDDCDSADCDALYVTDANGEHLATLHGAEFRARQLQNGALAIYRIFVNDETTTES